MVSFQESTNLPKSVRMKSKEFGHPPLLRDLYILPKSLSPEDKMAIINSHTSVMFVRHPFIRLGEKLVVFFQLSDSQIMSLD